VEFFLTGVAVVVCLLVLAGFLIRQGNFGWPKNSRPLCRRCGYLLEGLSAPRVCPECGNDLTRRRAIRLGENRKRRRVLICGLLVLALAGVAGHYTWHIGDNAGWKWDRIKPIWMLRYEARATHAALPAAAPLGWGSNPALLEIKRRMDRGDLSERQIRAVVADALDIQADAQQQWDPCWGDIIERAILRGLLTEEQVGRYLRQAYADCPYFKVAARAHANSSLEVLMTLGPLRASRIDTVTLSAPLEAEFRVELRDVNGRAVGQPHTGVLQHTQAGRQFRAPIDLAPGVHDLTLQSDVTLREVRGQDGAASRVLATWSRSQVIRVEVIDAERPLIDRRADESQRAALTNAVVVQGTPAWAMRPVWGVANSLMTIVGAPVAYSFDVYARETGVTREEFVGWIAGEAQSSEFCRMQNWPQMIFPNATSVDLILRTNPQHAQRLLSITEIWDGEIVIPNVLIRPPPATQPAGVVPQN
jgi:hypothetical protein